MSIDKKNKLCDVRRFTPDETDMLMGFPIGYTAKMGNDSKRYQGDGNSWAENCARFVIKGIHRENARIEGKDRGLKYGTISSGVECHSLASRGLGDESVFFSEIAPAPSAFLEEVYGNKNLGDMTLIDYDEEKGVITNKPYEGYVPPDEKALGFKPFKTDGIVEIPCKKGEIDLVSGGTPCWTKGAFVLTENGYVPIEDVSVGDRVVTHMGRFRKVLRVGSKKAKNIVTVKATGRPAFKVTSNHKFLTKDDASGHFVFKTISDIGVKGLICIPREDFVSERQKIDFPKVYSASKSQICELAGWYVGDGYIRGWKGRNKLAVVLCLNDNKLKVFEEKFKGVINYSKGGRIGNEQPIQICSTEFARWLDRHFGRGSSSKRIPAWLIAEDGEAKSAFVDGYMATDGSTDSVGAYHISTISPALAFGVSDLLSRTTVGEHKVAQKRTVKGVVYNQQNVFYVRKQPRVTKWSQRSIKNGVDYDYISVVSIEKSEDDIVYNIEVEEDHSYVCNGMMSSNCQDMSVAGKRHGAAEGSNTRSSLAFQLPRIGQALGTRWIMFENVPGIFSSNGGRDFLWFLYRMQEAGYTLAWRTLDAQYVRTDTHPRAVPQRRRRVWLVGYRGDDWRVPVRALFEPSKVLGYEPPQRVVGKGFTELNPSYVPDAEPYDEEEDIKTFLHYANPKIIERLVEKGLIESPDERLAKLKKGRESKTLGYMEFDLFGGGPSEPVHQGRGIRSRDLELNLPDESDILNCQFKVYSAAQGISRSVEFCGSLFDHLKDGIEPMVDDLSEKVLANIGNSGFMSKNFIVTMKSPEWNAGLPEEDIESLGHNVRDLYDGDVCGLSDILQDIVDEKYYLSWRACWGILNRAGKRGKKLPFELGYALVERIIEHSAFVKWCVMYASDVSKKEGKLSEREIAKICFNDFVTIDATWEEVHEIQPVRSSSDESDEDEDDEVNGLTEFIGLDEDGDDE